MSQKDKLIKHLKSKPKDFTYAELKSLLSYFGYHEVTKGKTSGSRVKFEDINGKFILLHKPHRRKELLSYQVNQILDYLNEDGAL